jgi:SSS family transporter
MRTCATFLLCFLTIPVQGANYAPGSSDSMLEWHVLPDLPYEPGVAGPFVGMHRDVLIVAGGADFADPFWESEKSWHDETWILTRDSKGRYEWHGGFTLNRPVAYGASASSRQGVVCLGGKDGENTLAESFLLRWDPNTRQLTQEPLPSLPKTCVFGAASIVGDYVYLAGGQQDASLESAMRNFWRLDLSKLERAAEKPTWEILPSWPGPARAFNLTVTQHNGFDECIYVISGRCTTATEGLQDCGTQVTSDIFALVDIYEFNPARFDPSAFDVSTDRYAGTGQFANPWRRRTNAPHSIMAGGGATIGQSHIFLLSGADGSLISRAEELRNQHPGFPRRTLAYHTITDTWVEAGPSPANQVTTPPVRWGNRVILASGEIKPRIRTPQVWAIEAVSRTRSFGAINILVLILYLAGMLFLGVYFAGRNKDTNDYFRGGQRIAWWVAGCSIFATMLSSITYLAIPAKAYAQDQVYLVGNLMILGVAPIAVYLALPFFRRIDATSAYEYLERRFNRLVRLFASASFTLFHLFRMGIVMSLAGLALATVTPLTATQCVLIMGMLSLVYCTMGGVEAVVWTDTIQTFVLIGGALLCFGLMVAGSDGGFAQFLKAAGSDGKLHAFNLHWDPTSTSLALWVIIIGGIGQNVSSYTADQAVVQRYMTTPDEKRAARSIWTAAIVAVPASLLFYGLGAALYVFYKTHPERLDPTYMTDQILPLFIAREVPIGIAGLMVAGIFAAAQSTISTSMNSTATTLVTDFLRPFRVSESEGSPLVWARGLTVLSGALGTFLGLLFISPDNRSLFDSFIRVIGLFMGVLGGLFGLGVLTRRANGWGALIGASIGAAVMGLLPLFSQVSGYLYAAIGVCSCFLFGYLASFVVPASGKQLDGLTLYTANSVWRREV